METSRIISIGLVSGPLPGWGVTPLGPGLSVLPVYGDLYRVSKRLEPEQPNPLTVVHKTCIKWP